jgi:hypothetical protein
MDSQNDLVPHAALPALCGHPGQVGLSDGRFFGVMGEHRCSRASYWIQTPECPLEAACFWSKD